MPADRSNERLSTSPSAISPGNEDPFTRIANTLTKGSWVEFLTTNGSSFNARFTWINPSSGSYLFVDRDGNKAPDRTPEHLASLLRSGHATVIQVPLQFNRVANAGK